MQASQTPNRKTVTVGWISRRRNPSTAQPPTASPAAPPAYTISPTKPGIKCASRVCGKRRKRLRRFHLTNPLYRHTAIQIRYAVIRGAAFTTKDVGWISRRRNPSTAQPPMTMPAPRHRHKKQNPSRGRGVEYASGVRGKRRKRLWRFHPTNQSAIPRLRIKPSYRDMPSYRDTNTLCRHTGGSLHKQGRRMD